MRTLRFALLLLWNLIGYVTANEGRQELLPIKDALVRSLCNNVYWEGQNYRLGIPLPLEVKVDTDNFFVRIDDLQVTKGARMSYFFEGRIKQGKAVVVTGTGYNVNLAPPLPGYIHDTQRLGAETIKDALTMPTDCTPHYDPPTPKKERMIETVVSTLQKQLSFFVHHGYAKYPREVTLTIADFNVDYPATFVLVDPPNDPAGDLFTVGLHNPQDYDNDEYERSGEYPFGERQVKPYLKPYLDKIRKHGIVRKITLAP